MRAQVWEEWVNKEFLHTMRVRGAARTLPRPLRPRPRPALPAGGQVADPFQACQEPLPGGGGARARRRTLLGG